MPPSRKKVIVRTTTGEVLSGYLAPSGFLLPEATHKTLDLLDLHGHGTPLPLGEVKLLCFVRDFNQDDQENPERLTRRAFLARPRAEGLWVRITFTNGDQLEGLAPQDTTLLDALIEDAGLFLTPPDERSNTHRIFVPRSAIETLELLSVVQAPSRKPARRASVSSQPGLFPD